MPVTLRVFTKQSHTYLNMLLRLRSRIGWNDQHREDDWEYFVVPFVVTCAAALECSLNDAIIGGFSEVDPRRTSLVSAYLSMSLRGKLDAIVPLLTDNSYRVNGDHKIYKDLAELIRLRNRLVHNKGTIEDIDALVVETDSEGAMFESKNPEDVRRLMERLDDPMLNVKGDPGRFHDSLESFHEKFLDAYASEEFRGNDLVVLDDA